MGIQQAIFERDTDALRENIEAYLLETVSVFDTGREAFFHCISDCSASSDSVVIESIIAGGTGLSMQLPQITAPPVPVQPLSLKTRSVFEACPAFSGLQIVVMIS